MAIERSPPFEDVLAVQEEFHCYVWFSEGKHLQSLTTQKPVDCLANNGKLMRIRPAVETFNLATLPLARRFLPCGIV